MRPDEDRTYAKNRPPSRGRDYSLYFFEQRGDRHYLRFTGLGLLVILLLILVPAIAILLLFNFSKFDESSVNINIGVPSATPYPVNPTLIKPAPAPSPLKNIKQLNFNGPAPSAVQAPTGNTNAQMPPRHTPPPTPSESPP